MKYKAIYKSPKSLAAAHAAAIALILNDTYYAFGGRPLVSKVKGPYGCNVSHGLNGRLIISGHQGPKIVWSRYEADKIEGLTPEDLPGLKGNGTVGVVDWRACTGNYISYDFSVSNQVVVTIDSRRHGIPCRAMAQFEPDMVIEYISKQPTWSPFDTLDNHRIDGR